MRRNAKAALIALIVCALAIAPFGACAGSQQMSPDIARIVARGELIVATTLTDQPPMYWVKADGSYAGIEYELAKGLADELGVALTYLRYSDDYSTLQNAVLSGEADMIIGCYSNTLERAKYLSFSDVYLSIGYGVMANSSDLVRYGIEADPVGHMLTHPVKLGVLGGSSHAAAARMLFPACEIIEVFLEEGDGYDDAYDKAAYMVAQGELFAYFCVELEFVLQYLKHKDLSIYTTAFSFADVSDNYAVGVRKSDAGLLEFTNLYLRQRASYSMDDIIALYIDMLGEGDAQP